VLVLGERIEHRLADIAHHLDLESPRPGRARR
jgi:hypothetical protein